MTKTTDTPLVLTEFDYLLNAFEEASQAAQPALSGYANKRKALLAYVRDLEGRAVVRLRCKAAPRSKKPEFPA